MDDIKAHSAKLEEFAINFEAIAIVNSMLIENINMQMESEIADLLDRRMMSLYGINEKKPDKLDAQNTSRKLQQAQHITTGGHRSPSPLNVSLLNQTSASAAEHNRASVTIGLNPSGTYSSIDGGAQTKIDEVPEEKIAITNEYRKASEALKATGKLPISIDNKCLMSMQDGRDTQIVLRLFKTACLSYAPTDVSYRDHKMSRA